MNHRGATESPAPQRNTHRPDPYTIACTESPQWNPQKTHLLSNTLIDIKSDNSPLTGTDIKHIESQNSQNTY